MYVALIVLSGLTAAGWVVAVMGSGRVTKYRRMALAMLMVVGWSMVAFSYWRQRQETADARACTRWTQATVTAYQLALVSGQQQKAAAILTRPQPAACHRLVVDARRP